jgi:hypothetical protein
VESAEIALNSSLPDKTAVKLQFGQTVTTHFPGGITSADDGKFSAEVVEAVGED